MKCYACGAEFDSGALIVGDKRFCPACREKFEDIIEDYVSAYVENKIFGTPLPNLDDYVNSRENDIAALKLPKKMFRRMILRRIAAIEMQR